VTAEALGFTWLTGEQAAASLTYNNGLSVNYMLA
jgi:hypothetical protein